MKTIYKALANFQQEVPVIFKGTSGYGYKYADLPTIFEIINPLLKRHGLGFTQLVNKESLQTILFHIESGEVITSDTKLSSGVSLAKMNEFQVLGSQITYLRRYAISSLLGLITDVDNDAHGEQVKPIAKVLIPITKENIAKAIQYLKSGHSVSELKLNYSFDSEIEKQLEYESSL